MEEVDEDLQDEFGLTGPRKHYYEYFANMILLRAKSLSCPQRSVYANNNKLEKKVEKLKLASRSDAGLFAQSLLLIRRKMKHKGIRLIHPADPEWLTIKDITKLATDFCNEFQIKPKLGYRVYIELGLGMMNFFSINRFKTLHGSICSRYESIQEVEMDKYPNRTRQIHDSFMATISAKTGLINNYTSNPEKYRYFVRAANEARVLGIDSETYIRAQFAAFDWKSAVPEPSQIYGDRARERVMKYCFENDISVKHKSQGVPSVDFTKIKRSHGKKRTPRKVNNK